MKFLITLLTLVFSLSASAAIGPIYSGPVNDQIQCGNALIANQRGLKKLFANTSSANRYATFKEIGAAGGYTPSGVKKFYLVCVQWTNKSGSNSDSLVFIGTDDMGFDSAASPNVAAYVYFKSVTAQTTSEFNPIVELVNGKYLTITGVGATQYVTAYGVEVP
jgi:hypothetical protein